MSDRWGRIFLGCFSPSSLSPFINALTPPVRSPNSTEADTNVIKQQRGGDSVAFIQAFDGVTAANLTVLIEGCAFTGVVAAGR